MRKNGISTIFIIVLSFLGLLPQLAAQQLSAGATASQSSTQPVSVPAVLPDAPLPEVLLKLQEAPTKFIGMTIRDLLLTFGVPTSVTAVRGTEPWQDDIVFKYPGGISFYIYLDRVWQISVGNDYKKTFMGFVLGSPLEVAVSMFGLPKSQDTQYSEWILPFENWPLRLRAILDANGKVTTLYLYRSDI